MIDRFIIRCCEMIDNVCDSIANIFVKPKKKKK
ncbi:hypothetical protein [uncultured Mediterranean phage uvMED]|nr:hypothetical protein [uncultured Mediterranean phage uvMED]BAQ91228.1 hypothetical protein [uncultured Mediterranean phage uvMED]BAR20024.1 hypothetical protein [uncultured Mediterranean phage uvMED]